MNQEREAMIHSIVSGQLNMKVDFTLSLLVLDILDDPIFYVEHKNNIHQLLIKYPVIADSFFRIKLWQTIKTPWNLHLFESLIEMEHPAMKNYYHWVELLEAFSTFDDEHLEKVNDLIWKHRYHIYHLIQSSETQDVPDVLSKLPVLAESMDILLKTFLCLHPKIQHLLTNSIYSRDTQNYMEKFVENNRILYLLNIKKPEKEEDIQWVVRYHLLGIDALLSEETNSKPEESILYV